MLVLEILLYLVSVGVNIIHSICYTLRATFNHGPTMYIVDVIGGRVALLLLRSVCVAKAAVGVAGQCLVRPELTFEYLTIGTSGQCLNPCSIGPERSRTFPTDRGCTVTC